VFAAVGCVLGIYAVLVASLVPDSLTLPAPVHLAVGLSFVGAGTLAWLRRPDNPTGLLMSTTGLVWFGRDFDWLDTAFTTHLDALATNLFIALVAHQLVVFPDGRVRSPWQRGLVYSVYGLATVGYAFTTLGPAANAAVDVAAAAAAMAILVQLAVRWIRASPPVRRALAPVIWTGPLVLAVVLVMLALDSGGPWPRPIEEGLHWAALVFVALPLAFLVGLLRTQLHRGVVTDLVVQLSRPLTPASLRDALAQTLGDPSLEVVYWLPDSDRYVDQMGRSVGDDALRDGAVTVLDHDGQRIAALLHDPQLRDEPELVEAAAAAARLALENTRLQAELWARLDEVRASRTRIISAGDAERRRIERDLHDGAQQRLLGIRLSLRLLHERHNAGPGTDDDLFREAEDELAGAIDDLRDLARGVHPAVLTDEGLGPALETLARRSSTPVTLVALPEHRLPAAVESAAYFVAAEALANAAKHAAASSITLNVAPVGDRLVIDIVDDGVGGAKASAEGGLAGLSDRVAALDGTIRIESGCGTGTRLHVEIPLRR